MSILVASSGYNTKQYYISMVTYVGSVISEQKIWALKRSEAIMRSVMLNHG